MPDDSSFWPTGSTAARVCPPHDSTLRHSYFFFSFSGLYCLDLKAICYYGYN